MDPWPALIILATLIEWGQAASWSEASPFQRGSRGGPEASQARTAYASSEWTAYGASGIRLA